MKSLISATKDSAPSQEPDIDMAVLDALSDADLDAVAGGIIIVGGITSRGLTAGGLPSGLSAYASLGRVLNG
ncbi:hypothetical protein [Methylobacterium nonmethylotrophicum]|uniref:Uncharacterized protein n=1 Tax=Methylobacterium nonmethylotrophicum TaxID=1141884 RepID=A0A4Z0NKT6_9HYPH|nr:hypothetical protein [Methylobacterium nonmethylotrophicum]TGD96749.1 hypothetical protein EU555_22060 [Methylobacterium nonmethylotrophicum]